MIPKQLRREEIKFCRIRKGTKKPFEKDWTNKPYSYSEIEKFLPGENYGVLCGYGGLIVIDSDEDELQIVVGEKLPETFKVRTGGGGIHNYYFCPDCKKKIILEKDGKHYGEVQSFGAQVVGPNSIHPSGRKYEVINDKEITTISYEQLLSAIKPFMKEIEETEKSLEYEKREYGDEINDLSVVDIWGTAGLKKHGSEYYGAHPIHGSETGMNFWINPVKNVWHCFRHNTGGGPLYAIAVKEGIIDCSEAVKGALRGDKAREAIRIAQEKYGLKRKEKKFEVSGEVSDKVEKIIKSFYDKRDLARRILRVQPLYYDNSKIWWGWDGVKWKIIDETDVLNFVAKLSTANTIKANEKSEILEALKQESRLNKPQPIKKTWIQFKDFFFDIETGEKIPVEPKYFATNPVPLELSKENYMETPTMDRIFEEWVGKKYVKTLYEIIAYCLLPSYPIHRIFCLIGDGCNGKGSFLRLLEKFIGKDNVTSTELDTLLTSRFEVSKLYKKLVCIMGETNFAEISKTSLLKKLTGQDLIGFEFKNKNPFEDYNYAKIIIATNNLPTTTDKTIGFYRRWLIIDFPNRFSEEKDILAEIPDEEFEYLALKCCFILKDLLDRRKFTNEGSIEERIERYEAKSNFLEEFIKKFTEEDPDGYITKSDFYKQFTAWCKENRHRVLSETSLGIEMKKLGIESSTKYFSWLHDGSGGNARVWVGIKWKNK